jgi:demethylmenaquinone methyltransferase/2-methoxy-6-polyprenyl-1,4-benzoquinol methylase
MTSAPPAPPEAQSDKRRYVREMFTAIAPRYDLLNHLLSFNIDRSWRRKAVDRLGWEDRARGLFLDACAGTLDLAAELANRRGFSGRVVGADFAHPMLRLGAGKVAGGSVTGVAADTLDLPFRDATFDGATVGFGLRNLESLDAGLRELRRVLRPSARLVILDFTTPPSAPLRALYLLYFRRVLPLVGRLVSGHPTAYAYLPASVVEFPPPQALAQRMADAGFGDCGFRLLTGGIAAIHWGTR